MGNENLAALAGIEYHGLPGISAESKDAVLRLVQYGTLITHARILSCFEGHQGHHCFLLTVDVGDLIAIKSGFGSGYIGEAPRTFSYVLQVLEAHGAEMQEYNVTSDFIERLDNSVLTKSDLQNLDSAPPVRPGRWHDYVFEKHWERKRDGTLWEEFRPVVPLAIIDSRIADLAISFWKNPNDRLLTGYRRLEDIVRARTGINEYGTKLLSRAFAGSESSLSWNDLDPGELAGRSQLFTGAFMSYRNPRAHREVSGNRTDQLVEFLLLNHLYCLEKESIKRCD